MPNRFHIALMLDKQLDVMSKRLFRESLAVMRRLGRESLDPIDVIIAALEDERMYALVRPVLTGITLEQALEQSQKVADHPNFEGGGVLESFQPEMTEALKQLYESREQYLAQATSLQAPRLTQWDWTAQFVAHALASNSPAAIALRSQHDA